MISNLYREKLIHIGKTMGNIGLFISCETYMNYMEYTKKNE